MSATTRHYTAYGLRIRSELALPLQPDSSRAPDLLIRNGAVPEALAASRTSLRTWEAAPGRFLLKVEGVARYLVREGREIVVERAGDREQATIAFLLGSVLAVCLQQRGILTLHASAIEHGVGAVLFTGHSGAGKSTYLAALIKRGYTMLSDDVTGVVLDARYRPVALPAFPYTRLWADAAKELEWPVSEKVVGKSKKYQLPVERFRDSPLAVRAVFAPTFHNRKSIEIEMLSPADAFTLLVRRTYRRQQMRELGQQPGHFLAVAAMARQVPVYGVRRPRNLSLLDALTDRIEDCLREARSADTDGQPAAMASPAARVEGTKTSR